MSRNLTNIHSSIRTLNNLEDTSIAGTNLNKVGLTINLDTDLINLDTINTFKIGLSAIGSASTLLRNSHTLSSDDYLQINSDGFVVGVSLKENKNAILGSDNTSGIIAGSNITKTIDASNGNITLASTNTEYTTQTPLVIINGVIGLNGISGYGSSIGRRQLIRTNATSTGLEYFDQPDFITSVTAPLAISSSGVISLSTLN